MPGSTDDLDDEITRANIRTVLSLLLHSTRDVLVFASIVHSMNTLLVLVLNYG